MTRVHVVAWHYDGGAGFDWYYDAKAADTAFEVEEKKNCHEFRADAWTAYRFDFDAERAVAYITDEIDEALDYLCEGCDARALNLKTYRA